MFDFKVKATALTAILALALTGASGCSQSASAQAPAGKEASPAKKMSIVCTIFPEYDWVKQLLGDKAADADITYLLGSGTDLHSYKPTADDIVKISGCDLFLYVGGESDEWAEDALENATNKDMRSIKILDAVGGNAKIEEVKEGMQGEEEEEEEEEGCEEEPEYDEHVWLSVRNSKLICSAIADELCGIDPANADTYKANLAAYSAELDKLDGEIKSAVDGASRKTVVFGDRFPFRYFVDDYGLDYYAAFVGCSAETEASFETIVFLANKVDELGCKTVFTIENSDKSIANTIISSTKTKDANIAELNSLQSVSREQADGGVTYLSLMRGNCEVLKENLK